MSLLASVVADNLPPFCSCRKNEIRKSDNLKRQLQIFSKSLARYFIMNEQDDSEADRREKMLKEANWQKLAAPLFCLREIRELVTFDIQQSQDSEREQKLLERILVLETKHLKRCLREDSIRTLNELRLDRLDSWQEVIDFLKLSGDVTTSIELAQLMPAARRIVEKLRPDLG